MNISTASELRALCAAHSRKIEHYIDAIWDERERAYAAREWARRTKAGDVFRRGIVLPFAKPSPQRKSLHPCVRPLKFWKTSRYPA